MADQQMWNAWRQFEQSGKIEDYMRYRFCEQKDSSFSLQKTQRQQAGEETDAYQNTGDCTAT
ncbi:MAG: hypothetical protein ACOX60_06740 [Massiliimalia sp.]